ncbi:MAG: hypothetical protein WCW30_05140 [Candidatus Gracilibacteria bacterium]|jgi:hypothetical protein
MNKVIAVAAVGAALAVGMAGYFLSPQKYHKFNVHYSVVWSPDLVIIDPSIKQFAFLGSADADIELVFPAEGGNLVQQNGTAKITGFVSEDPNCIVSDPKDLFAHELSVEFNPSTTFFTLVQGEEPRPKIQFQELAWAEGVNFPLLEIEMSCPVVGSFPLNTSIYPLVLGVFDDHTISADCLSNSESGYACYVHLDSPVFNVGNPDTLSEVPFMNMYLATIEFTVKDLGEIEL